MSSESESLDGAPEGGDAASALATAPTMHRLSAPWPAGDASTESRLAAIAREVPSQAKFLAAVADALDPQRARRQRTERRDAALHEAAQILRQSSISGTAKEIERELRQFISRVWPRQRDFGEPSPDSSALRNALWRIAKETSGDGLAWRQILGVIEK